jgi:hydrogenase nickel incorporation protein HypA/HybF
MHELSVCRALIREAERVVRDRCAHRVARLSLRVGALSGVEPALLRDAFPAAAAGSCAQGARLEIERVPLRVACDACGAQTAALPNRLTCGACGQWRTRLLSGDELMLASVELVFDAEEAPYV